MTRFADPDIYACPGCEACFTRSEVTSFNFSGTRDWSDGTPAAWWAVSRRPLVRCLSCAALFWIDELTSLGVQQRRPSPVGRFERFWAGWRGDPHGRLREEQHWLQIPEAWQTARSAGTASFEDVVYVLAHSEGQSLDKLVWLRRDIWWTLNDRYRTRSDGTPIPNVPHWPEADERANMEALLGLLDMGEMDARDQVQKGELLRLLGRFDEAIAVLKAVPADGHNETRAVRIERLARAGDTQVRPLSEEKV